MCSWRYQSFLSHTNPAYQYTPKFSVFPFKALFEALDWYPILINSGDLGTICERWNSILRSEFCVLHFLNLLKFYEDIGKNCETLIGRDPLICLVLIGLVSLLHLTVLLRLWLISSLGTGQVYQAILLFAANMLLLELIKFPFCSVCKLRTIN